eukprot:Colp12_sorted_trinity150504_noHs@4401
MALLMSLRLPNLPLINVQCSCFHTSRAVFAGQKHRISLGMARSNNEYGPLVDLPDWSYADGRPAPPHTPTLRRDRRQMRLATQIQRLTKEITMRATEYPDPKGRAKLQQKVSKFRFSG